MWNFDNVISQPSNAPNAPALKQAYFFDNDWKATQTAAYPPNGNSGLVSFWIKRVVGASTFYVLSNYDSTWVNPKYVQVYVTNTGQVVFNTRGDLVSTQQITTAANSVPADGNYHHVLLSWFAGVVQICVDGVLLINQASPVGTGSLFYENEEWCVGAFRVASPSATDAYLGELWVYLNQSLDLTVSSNIAKFFNSTFDSPVELGLNGEVPVGSRPHIYLIAENVADGVNLGTLGDFETGVTVSNTVQSIPVSGAGAYEPPVDMVTVNNRVVVMTSRPSWETSPQTNLRVYDYSSAATNYEGITEYHPNFYDNPLLVEEDVFPTTLGVSSSAMYLLTNGTDRLYAIKGSTVEIYNALTGDFVDGATLSFAPNGKPVYGNGKIWYTDAADAGITGNDRQKLYSLDLSLLTNSGGVEIPTRKQFTPHVLAFDSTGGWVVILNYNNSSIMKFSATTGSHSATIMVNRKPSAVFIEGGDALVGSKNGMVSNVDLSTNAATNVLATFTEARGLVSDGSFVWSIIEAASADSDTNTPDVIPGALARTAIGGSPYYDNFRVMTGASESYALSTEKFPQQNFKQILITPEFTYGSPATTVSKYVFLRSDNYIYGFRAKSLYRENSTQVRGTAMIATGPEKYFGETT